MWYKIKYCKLAYWMWDTFWLSRLGGLVCAKLGHWIEIVYDPYITDSQNSTDSEIFCRRCDKDFLLDTWFRKSNGEL